MSSAKHFYLTFNPFLNQDYEHNYTQAHEFYDFLKELKTAKKSSSAFWGKMIAKDRESRVDVEKFQTIVAENSEEGLSTHLYITDFKHLWVGQVKSVGSELPKKANTLSFYEGKNVEIWFEIEDFFLLEHAAEETATKLSEFYIDNEYSELTIDGLSPFTTKVTYPCVMQDLAEEQYFDEFDDDQCSHLIFKPNPSITKSSSDIVLKTLYTYVFPEEMYAKLPHAAKLEIEACEMDMLESRHHNMHKIAFSYLKSLEIVLNDLVIHHIRRKGLADQFYVDATSAPAKLYLNPSKDFYIPLKQHNKNFSLQRLINFVDRCHTHNNLPFKKAFSEHKSFVRFLIKDFGEILKDNHLIEIRNALAHGDIDKLSFKDANAVRNIVLGSGTTPGLIGRCYMNFYKEKFSGINSVKEFGKKTAAPKPKGANLKLVG